jgi:hypothetical protein
MRECLSSPRPLKFTICDLRLTRPNPKSQIGQLVQLWIVRPHLHYYTMSAGKMILHRFNGDEIYNVELATIKHHKDEDGSFSVTFRADTSTPPVQTLPDTESLHAKPFAEWTFTLPKIPALALQASRSFTMPEGYDKRTHEYYTNFYYCEHEPMDENEMVILERDDLRIRIRLTGMTTDVNYYDGSKPRTKVLVEADFTLSL